MKTIQITIDERPLKVVDKMSRARNPTQSAFIRDALGAEIQRRQIREDEIRHAGGCTRKLVTPGEFDDPKRSNALVILARIRSNGLLTEDEFATLSPETRNAIRRRVGGEDR